MLNAIEKFNDTYESNEIIVDFAFAFIDAIKFVYPSVRVKGCYFHFWQSVFRHLHLQREGL